METDDPAVVDDAVDDRGGHVAVAEHVAPPAEFQVRGEHHAPGLVAVGYDLEQEARAFDVGWTMRCGGMQAVAVDPATSVFTGAADPRRDGQAAAYSIVLFLYIVLVAFLFVKLLGADVVGDPEAKAMAEARKRRKVAARQAKAEGRPVPKPVRSTITSGDSPS